jgi:hypothetical protein
MRVLQFQRYTRKIAVAAGGVSRNAGDPWQIDIAQGRSAACEPLAGVRDLRRRQNMAEGAVEGHPVVFGGHESSLLRSPL